jgi:hypothetical protein
VPVTLTVPAGTAEGSYPVKVTVSGPGVAAVTRTVTVVLRTARCASTAGGQCAIDLAEDRNHDGTATVAASGEGNFDGLGWSYDGALLPAAGLASYGGVTYAVADPTGTAANFVQARGQQVLLPAGKYASLRLLGATHGGDVQTSVTVTYADGSTASVPLALTDWAAGSGHNGNTLLLAMDHRIKAGQGVDGPPVQLYGAALALDASKTVRSIALPNDSRLEVYAATLVA